MPTRIVFAPKLPKPVIDVAMSMLPPGYEFVVVDPTGPEFLETAREPFEVCVVSVDHRRTRRKSGSVCESIAMS